MKASAAVAVAVFLATFSTQSQAGIFTNGGFEFPALPADSSEGFSVGDVRIPGWAVGGTAGISLVNGFPASSIGSVEGSQYVAFNGGIAPASIIQR